MYIYIYVYIYIYIYICIQVTKFREPWYISPVQVTKPPLHMNERNGTTSRCFIICTI